MLPLTLSLGCRKNFSEWVIIPASCDFWTQLATSLLALLDELQTLYNLILTRASKRQVLFPDEQTSKLFTV